MTAPQLLCVAPHLVDQIWPSVVHLIESALAAAGSDLTADHIKARIDGRKPQRHGLFLGVPIFLTLPGSLMARWPHILFRMGLGLLPEPHVV